MKRIVLIFAILLAIVTACEKQHEETVFSFSNDNVARTIFANSNGAGKISLKTVYDPDGDKISTVNEVPFFEFVINDKLVSSDNEIWQFTNLSERKMGNEGTEYKVEFEIVKGENEGLRLTLYQQFFPSSALIREKIKLSAPKDKYFPLSLVNGQEHFVFPRYAVANEAGESFTLTEIRIASWEEKPTTFGEPKGNHMYYPKTIVQSLFKDTTLTKGPVNILSNGNISILSLYEHASQDNTNGMFDEAKKGSGNKIVDAMQGTKGVFDFEVADKDFWFLGFENKVDESLASVSVNALRGAYLNGELIDAAHPYESVWTATAFYEGNDIEKGKALLRHFQLHQICEKPASRKPEFYYNTWGLQRNDPSKPLRGILTYDRIFEEIEYAAQLGVDIFVLDDGWEQAQGVWTPHSERLPQGLAPIKQRLDELGITMGLWLSPMGIDSTAERYHKHPEWVIKDSEGNPIKAQWGHPAFDFVGPFFDVFIDDCKKLIDQGCRFMKWDAINTFYSTLPGLHHGDESYSDEERRARYEYLLPIYVTRAMEILTDYEPELVIEIDLTEARRVMTGFAPLSQGKLFWMNNGASTYNDYSVYRTQSMRTIANEYAGIIPWELFTYASYPHNIEGDLVYNTHSAILAGHGFWGNLSLMDKTERETVAYWVKQAKPIIKDLVDINPVVQGKVGDSPEIYTVINEETGNGQIIGFSQQIMEYPHDAQLNTKKVLAVLHAPFKIAKENIEVHFNFSKEKSSIAAFVVSNHGEGVAIQSSSVPLTHATLKNNVLSYKVKGMGEQVFSWDAKMGAPKVEGIPEADFSIAKSDNGESYYIYITNKFKNQSISIQP